jgi:D-alanine-D-alanine ligase-like ATP-grasp enzyme
MFCIPGMTHYRSLLDLLKIPYIGNTPDIMAITAHKARAKAIVAAAGVKVPRGEILRSGDIPTIKPPAVVKPASSDNSLGVTLVKENQSFYNDIDFLMKTEKNATNIDKIQESINNITKRMLEKDVEETVVTESIGLPPSMFANILVSKFNSKYSEINETEIEIIKTVLNGNKDEKKSLFESVKRECIDNIDKKLNESSDVEIKDKLLKVKDKLLNTNFEYENFNSQIGKIYNLKESID